jgi:hypothetical protein
VFDPRGVSIRGAQTKINKKNNKPEVTITITVTKANKLSVGKRNKDNVKRVRTYLISEERRRYRGASCVFEVAPPVIVEIASVTRAV